MNPGERRFSRTNSEPASVPILEKSWPSAGREEWQKCVRRSRNYLLSAIGENPTACSPRICPVQAALHAITEDNLIIADEARDGFTRAGQGECINDLAVPMIETTRSGIVGSESPLKRVRGL